MRGRECERWVGCQTVPGCGVDAAIGHGRGRATATMVGRWGRRLQRQGCQDEGQLENRDRHGHFPWVCAAAPAARRSDRPISLAVEVVVVLNFLLDFGHGLDFVRQLGRIHEVRINLGEIHYRQVEPRELVDREANALFLFRRPPRLAELHTALLLEDAGELALEAAISGAPRAADAEETRRAIGAEIMAQAHPVLDVEPHLVL